MTQELATQAQGGVPALAYSPTQEMTSEDIALPKLKIGQGMTGHVQEGRVKAGSIFTELSADDPDPVVLSECTSYKDGAKDPVTFYVLGWPRKGKSLSSDGELETWDFNDPEAPKEAWTTYGYTIVVPDFEDQLPFKMLLTRTNTPAAKQINLILQKAAAFGDPSEVAFELTTAFREKDSHKWHIAQVRQAQEPTTAADRKKREAQIEVVRNLAALVQQAPPQAASVASSDEPAI
jgi:hypothetical protein